jgi:hypothetical protein
VVPEAERKVKTRLTHSVLMINVTARKQINDKGKSVLMFVGESTLHAEGQPGYIV